MPPPRTELARVSRAYQREARRMSYRELRTRQRAPWASVAFGAAGIAAALLACPGRRAGTTEQARRWLAAAARGSRARDALWPASFGPSSADGSLYCGRDGIELVRLLGVRAAGAGRGEAIRRFLERCRRRRGGPSELLHGTAGYLAALVVLHRTTGDPRVAGAADELAHDLLERAGGPAGWARSPSLGFAHGRAGTSHALLGWSLALDRELPAGFFHHLHGLARELRDRGGCPALGGTGPAGRVLDRSWCNGAAGHALHWARAYERTSDASYLRAARDAARLVATHTDAAPGNLCCGLGGRAYALLAVDRIEPGRGWFERAVAMGSLAARAMIDAATAWPNGLYKGYPGLVCLDRELVAHPGERVGFPLIEGLAVT
jgi:serine/threonine-protein kinase